MRKHSSDVGDSLGYKLMTVTMKWQFVLESATAIHQWNLIALNSRKYGSFYI
ncbi:hypothetical protein WUBG_17328 [Wuchereria bancrofti]|uniref:Uncharacterized protein n=1 Tax=Wuchereria bancrofti TaxID=6293 RepID=J9E483_WUCBA|nr:hypothetical protein WUBG_17328 [Wuchereria bancrofti]